MKRILMIVLLLAVPFALADADVEVAVWTEGNVDADFYCGATGDCNYNIHNGNVNTSGNMTVNNNDYVYYEGDGWSFGQIVNYMQYQTTRFNMGKTMSRHFSEFIDTLAQWFVLRTEFGTYLSNMEYLAQQQDVTNAKIKYMERFYQVWYDDEVLESYIGMEEAKRTGERVITEHGFICDPKVSEQCYKLE